MAGVLSFFVVLYVQNLLTQMVKFLASGLYTIKENENGSGTYMSFNGNVFNYVLYNFLLNVFAIAFSEEFFKDFFCLLMIVFVGKVLKKEQLKTTYECILYATATAIGFALIEDILYVINEDIVAAIMRIATQLSGHMFYGAIFGYFMAKARSVNAVNTLSEIVSSENDIENRYKKNPFVNLIIGFIIAMLAHGIYDTLVSIIPSFESIIVMVILYVIGGLFVVASTIFCIILIKKGSKNNEYFANIAKEECKKLYPEVEF